MVDNFYRGHFPYNTLGWCLISWDFSHMGSAYPYSCRMHVTFQEAWSTNSIELYMRNMCLESIWLGALVLRPRRGLRQYWAKTTMWFGPEMIMIITSIIHWAECIKTSMIHWSCSFPSMSMFHCPRHELTRTWIHRAHMKGKERIIMTQGWISVDRGNKVTLPLTMPYHVFKSSAKDSACHPFGRKFWGSPPQLDS
jgi:hypothetical protein